MNANDKERLRAHANAAIEAVDTLRSEVDSWPVLDGTAANYHTISDIMRRLYDARIAIIAATG